MERSLLKLETTELVGGQLNRLKGLATLLAIIGAVLAAIGFILSAKQFFVSYLFTFLFWYGVTMGCIGFLMLHHTVGGGWGFVIRRFLETGASMWWLAFLMWLPVVLGLVGFELYKWNLPGAMSDPLLAKKELWLNAPRWIGCGVAYFLIWGLFAQRLLALGRRLEQGDEKAFEQANRWGGAGIVVHALLTTLAVVDWLMTIEPAWMSSIIGLHQLASQGLSTLALLLVLLAYLSRGTRFIEEVPVRYFRDLGNLTLATVMLWGYMSFSQYLITYSGNTAEEIIWYLDRQAGGWGIISLGLIVVHFALPFLVLVVAADRKDNPQWLGKMGLYLVAMRLLDLFWWVAPTYRESVLALNPADLGLPLLLGGIWLLVWTTQLSKRTLAPVGDPRLEEHWYEVAHYKNETAEAAPHG